MFKQTRLKLTFFYSILFFSLFWIFSFGLYFWMDRSFGEDYISQVKLQQTQRGQYDGEFDDSKNKIVTIAGDVALSQLRIVLITINAVYLFVIPIISWYLAKKSLARIQIAHEKQKQFVSDASHELRTPLSIMNGEIEVTLQKKRSVTEYERVLESNKEELVRLTSLVENLLFLAREDQSHTKTLSDFVDITDVLSSLIMQLKPVYTKKHLTVYFKPAQENITVQGSTILLRQLFFNLLDNAIKYTDSGKISITLNKKSKQVLITIKDTGVGIGFDNQTKIFNRFYRADVARSEKKGYGLGLAICKAIVQRHKGTISFSSALGKGTTFSVLLPEYP